jgi:hypothetical protein
MHNVLWLLLTGFGSAFGSRRGLALENLALRQQLAALGRTCKRPRLEDKDRLSGSGCHEPWAEGFFRRFAVDPKRIRTTASGVARRP